jgi:hypothetical protein
MKRLFTLLAVFGFTVSTFAQITVTETEMAQIGDQITRYQDTIISFGPGPEGPNQSWDFSGNNLVQRVTNTTSVIDPSTTPYANDFPNSNVAMTNDNTAYAYFSQSSNELITDGAAGDLLMTGEIILTPLNPTSKLHEFPKTYGDNFCDPYAFDVTVDGSAFSPLADSARLKHVATICDTVDGWGTITTPVGTYNCLRVKRVEYALDSSFFLPTFGLPPSWTFLEEAYDTNTSYAWLTMETKLAVAEFTYDSLDQPRAFTWSAIQPQVTTGLDENQQVSIEVFPNPASDIMSIRGLKNNQVADIRLYDQLGKMVVSERLRNNNKLSIENLQNGIYFYELYAKEEKLKSGKLVIAR